ncbi:hypothetical protein [Streptomyces sp. SYSU K21746]
MKLDSRKALLTSGTTRFLVNRLLGLVEATRSVATSCYSAQRSATTTKLLSFLGRISHSPRLREAQS